jgi:hypothetical protein
LDEASYSNRRFGEGPATVAMTILNWEKTKLYSFVFKRPRRVAIEIPSDDPLYFEEGKTLGQVHLYEVRSVTPEYLAAEWLLDTGGTILIEFEKLGYRSKRLRSSQRKR